MVTAKEDMIDYYERVRIIKNKDYKILRELEDSYLIIDNIGKEISLSKIYFYELEEGV